MGGLGLSDQIVLPCAFVGICFAVLQFFIIKKVDVDAIVKEAEGALAKQESASTKEEQEASPEKKAQDAYVRIMAGAETFLREEYKIAALFCVVFAGLIFGLVSWGSTQTQGGATAGAFLVGATTSMLCGYLGMMIATFSNIRTTLCARNEDDGYTKAFNIAFRGGGVMGYLLCSLGVFILWALLAVLKNYVFSAEAKDLAKLMDCAAGYGLGGSTVAMFGRVGGGIYTKAADVGADLVGKVVAGLEEDDPRNPATIADNVGDNVGDIAGMGADLFGSFAESTCASLVIAASIVKDKGGSPLLCLAEGENSWEALMFPLALSATGIIVCMVCSFVATDIFPVKSQEGIEKVLKLQMVLTALIMLPVTYKLADLMLPEEFLLESVRMPHGLRGTPSHAFLCVAGGTIGGLIIGLITEYYTSHSYTPVQELATACKRGAAVNVIFGMALGYKSCIIPVFILAANIYVSFSLCDLYGIALAALGMLSTLATGLTIDGFGPISDNAGGIAEMAEFEGGVRDRTDALDAAGNTTAAIGKGFAIGSAALVSLALYGAFVVRLKGIPSVHLEGQADLTSVNVMEPTTFAALLIGAMIPYWFAALTMKSVGEAAGQMVEEVSRQFNFKDGNGKKILEEGQAPFFDADGKTQIVPDYDRCIAISTKSSLYEMIAPGALVIGSPLVIGSLFGVKAVFGLLTGSLVSSVQLAISMSNSGGAWDNCKKFIKGSFSADESLKYGSSEKDVAKEIRLREKEARKKGEELKLTDKEEKAMTAFKLASDAHDAAVQGDTVGDPFKDTSGPALNIVMKLQAIVSLVFAAYFAACSHGNGMVHLNFGNNTQN
jgi:inorganic pyrophosphatase